MQQQPTSPYEPAHITAAHTFIGVCPITGNNMYTHKSEEDFHPLLSACVFRPENHGFHSGEPVYFSTLCQFGGPAGDAARAHALAKWAASTGELARLGKELARAIIQGNTAGRVPTKRELIAADDCVGEYVIPALRAPVPARCAPAQAVAPLAGQDVRRLAMMCVYYDSVRGVAVATCGHVLLCFPCGPLAAASGLLHPRTLEPLRAGDVVNKRLVEDGDERARFPDYVGVLDEATPRSVVATLDVQALRNQLAGIARASRFVSPKAGIRARIQHEGQEIFFDAARGGLVLRAMQASGTSRVQLELSGPGRVVPGRALQFRDVDQPGKLALLMPLPPIADQAFCAVLDTAAGGLWAGPGN